MARQFGSGTVVVRRTTIACLAAYLTRARSRLRAAADLLGSKLRQRRAAWRTEASIHAGPVAFGVPTSTEPVLVDLSASLTTNGMTARLHRRGRAGAPMAARRGRPRHE
jgi:L-lactate dehydrogenase